MGLAFCYEWKAGPKIDRVILGGTKNEFDRLWPVGRGPA